VAIGRQVPVNGRDLIELAGELPVVDERIKIGEHRTLLAGKGKEFPNRPHLPLPNHGTNLGTCGVERNIKSRPQSVAD
jgi:hypothetical protein